MALSLRSSRIPNGMAVKRAATARVSKPLMHRSGQNVQPRFVVRAESEDAFDSEKLMKDLKDRWEKVENKPQAVLYGVGGVFGLWAATNVIGTINQIPLLPKAFEFVGLGYSAWFTYRYLLFKSTRDELLKDVEGLKSQISGK